MSDKYIGKLLDDRYEILEVIGEGGMAVVYKAFCHRLNRYDAVKIMRDDMANDEEFRRRFCAESHAIAMLSHPNIVAVYDVSHNDDIEYIVMELVDGITLKQYMEKRKRLAWKEALHFTKQIARALSHAHERGIIHRDIKPQNIMLLKDGTIKVADFGIAALENEIHENNGEAVGSVHYMAPEQARGECPDARSDIYSLGIMMYEMFTGQLPYTGDSLGEIAVKHMSAAPTPPHLITPELPPELESITLRAMNPNLNDRYQSASNLIDDLEMFTQMQKKQEESEEASFEHPAVMPVRSISELSRDKYVMRRRRSRRVSYLSGVFCSLLLIVGLIAFLWNFWLGDVFSPAERIPLPSFIDKNYEAVVNNAELDAMYNFRVVIVLDTERPAGTIIGQSPEAGRSVMLTQSGIDVELTVSSGLSVNEIPDVINKDYREATQLLQSAGFVVDLENAVSSSVTRDYVIDCNPSAGEQLSTGSTVYITVSSGPQILTVSMPNLIGLSEEAARNKLEANALSYGGSTYETSELSSGTVIGQSVDAFEQVEEHSKIYLRVSTGPEE